MRAGMGPPLQGSSCCLEPVREQRGFAQQEKVKHTPVRSSAWPGAGKLGSSTARFTDAIKLLEKLQNLYKVVVIWFGVYINRLEKVIA